MIFNIVTAQQQPQPQQKTTTKCSWVETKLSLGILPPTPPPQTQNYIK